MPAVPGKGAGRSGSWERGRPARMWAVGPPVCSCGQDARGPRERRRAERFLGVRAARPHVGRRPTRVFMRARCPRSQGKAPCGAVPGSAGGPPAHGPKAHPWVQAGKMPALPGKAPCGAVPGSAGGPPSHGPKAHPWVQAGKMPAVPGKGAGRRGSWERGRPARMWAEGPPVGSSGQDARGPGKGAVRRGSWERGRPARMWTEGSPVCSSGQDARGPRERRRAERAVPGIAGVPPASTPAGLRRVVHCGPPAGCPFPASGRGGRDARDPGKTAPMCQASTGAARWLGRESNGGRHLLLKSRMTSPAVPPVELH